ncbi:PhoX family phosphatase [Ramlibacter sp. USB13]|uniref:PhoX family phosphatase n=1 Tax=Ramlibacter cellulosilyticus TaxID=2764187 RepID=A0A923SBN0_9BURK|nr:PhoX family phosphatase [Ramlibacter cellulosilyticus]MBC5783343.1 PhoX family phosphatase [Ramlibacter cellulosilyticus]
MSHLTDKYREASRARNAMAPVPGQMMEDVLAQSTVPRRTLLRGGFGAAMAAAFGGAMLTACGGGSDGDAAATPAPAPAPAAPPSPPPVSYAVTFKGIPASVGDQVTVPEGYTMDVLFAAGDAVVAGAAAYAGTPLDAAGYEQVAGGNHDGMHLYAIPGKDPNTNALLAINHEAPDSQILYTGAASYNPATATADQKKIVLSSVGVSVIEIERIDGKWTVKRNSAFNKRYTGNTVYQVGGPAATLVGPTVVGTLNNCASGSTPWGTYLTCEETTDNYLDPSQPEVGYGWVVEIDPQGTFPATKRTALGRFDHENTAYMLDADNTAAIYMGDDSTPGCVYKFVPSARYNPDDRAANRNLLDSGTLYAAKFNADGTGQWLELTQGRNGLVTGAQDPGNYTQSAVAPAPVTTNFATQADVLVNTKAAARVAGATLMDRPEWVTVGPDKKVYMTFTNNGPRVQTDAANPRPNNSHGHVLRWDEDGNTAKATTFKWEVFLLAGDPRLATANLKGNIVGDTFSSPDGIGIDPQGRLWVETDASTSASTTSTFGNNAMYHLDQVTRRSTRFLVGPNGCEITGLTYSPDLTTFFINIQHPTGTWPSNVQGNALPPRSATIVVRRSDGKPVGA